MADINEFRLERAEEIEMETLWDCHEHEYFSQEHIEQCLDKMMAAYIGDERNYVVDGAEIECSEMCKVSHCIKYENGKTKLYNVTWEAKGIERDYIPPGKEQGKAFYFGREQDVTKVRRLYALHANGASDNGIRFATVLDRDCLRDVKEGVLRPAKPDAGMQTSCAANIISCGNCRIMRESDIAEIEKRWDESMKYGTCYSLIKPVTEWVNLPCAESVSGNCDTNNSFASDIGVGEVGVDTTECNNPEHHKVMKFDTKYGQREGLTMMSSLLCTRGGVITITFHGQIYLDGGEIDSSELDSTMEEKIQDLMDSIEGKPVNSFSEICNLSSVEILARLIYQEDRDMNKGQNAVTFSIVNRLFSNANFLMRTKSNSIYSVITGLNQYESLGRDSNRTPNSYRPPISESDSDMEKEAWENAKRLAAITFIAVEEYGNTNEGVLENGDRNEKIIKKGDMEAYQQIIEFMEQQEDINGQPIKNEIDMRDSLMGQNSYDGRGREPIVKGGNYFFWYE